VDEIQIASETDCGGETARLGSQQLRRPTKNRGWRPWVRWETSFSPCRRLKSLGLRSERRQQRKPTELFHRRRYRRDEAGRCAHERGHTRSVRCRSDPCGLHRHGPEGIAERRFPRDPKASSRQSRAALRSGAEVETARRYGREASRPPAHFVCQISRASRRSPGTPIATSNSVARFSSAKVKPALR
jgi:hypothetical protein